MRLREIEALPFLSCWEGADVCWAGEGGGVDAGCNSLSDLFPQEEGGVRTAGQMALLCPV